MEFGSLLCGSLDGTGVWGRIDTCICMAESLLCSPETITKLLIGWFSGKESACNAENLGSIPGLGRSPGAGNGTPLQYSRLGNPTDRGAWRAPVHRVTALDTTQ